MRAIMYLMFSVILLLGGCARLNSIHRVHKVNTPTEIGEDTVARGKASATIVTVDAKQRHLLIAPELGTGDTRFRMCVEAAPDVFSAYASSLGADVGIGVSDRNAKVASSIAETAATIERTQTVNLLRESMYRTCERYLSGALSKDQFIIQAARDQRSMVAILAIEQLTGAIRAKPTIISGPATSASVIDGEEAAKLIERFRKEEETAKANLATAEKTHASAIKAGKCDTVAEKPAPDAKDPTADEWAACKGTEAILAQRKDELKIATGRLDKALTLAADFVSKSNASTTAGTNEGDTYTNSRPGDAALIAVARSVETIVMSPGIDEPLMFCIAYLQREKDQQDDSAITACLEIIKLRAKDDQEMRQKMLGLANVNSYADSIVKGRNFTLFEKDLGAQIKKTDPKKLAKTVEAFEKAAGIELHLEKGACAAADSCINAIHESYLGEFYFKDGPKLEAALQNWTKLTP